MSSTTDHRPGPSTGAPSWRRVFQGGRATPPAVSIPRPRSHGGLSTPTTSGTLDWDGADVVFTRPNGRRASATYTKAGAAPLTVTLDSAYAGNMKSGAEFVANGNTNFTLQSRVGGLDAGGVCLEQSTSSWDAPGSQDRGTYTFTFSRPVTNLRFTVCHINGYFGDSWDAVVPSPGYVVVSKATKLLELSDPGFGGARAFANSGTDDEGPDETGAGGNLTLSYAGPVTLVSLTVWNAVGSFAGTVDTDQRLTVSDLTFDFAP